MWYVTFFVFSFMDQAHVGPFKTRRDAEEYAHRVRQKYPRLLTKGVEATITDRLYSPTFTWCEAALKYGNLVEMNMNYYQWTRAECHGR